MNLYGSQLWYNATSNSDKLAINVRPENINTLIEILENSDVNYFGYDNGKKAKISINRDDWNTLKEIVGEKIANALQVEDIQKVYNPPEMDVFGTVEYKYIAKKTRQFLTAKNAEEQKALLRTAELLQREGVSFSGRVYPDKTTLTFSENDKQRVDELYTRVLEKRKSIDFSTQPMEKDVRAKSKISEEDINRANLVNLPQFLMSHGLDLKKVGKEYIWEEHDSLHIKDNQFGERGQWFRFSEDKGGNNIQFLNEYMGMTFVEAVEALNHEQYYREHTYFHQHNTSSVQEQKTAKEFSVLEDDNAKRVIAYLCKTRGLEYNMVADLIRQGIISQEQKTGNVLFKYFDEHGKVIGAEKVGTSTEQKYKGIATGSASGRGFEVVRGTGESVYFFESAIDMLSYLQTNSEQLNNCRLVSMMGVKPNTVLEIMQRHNIAPENVYLCSDNDKAGNDFAQKLQSQYPDMKRISTPDTYKDWNDMLRGIPKTGDVEDIYTENQLVKITTQIRQKQAAFTDLVNAGDFDNASVVSQELSQLTEQARTLKATIQKEEITQKDVAALRDIEPKRKSVQNMTEPEVARTPKFEKMLGEELGEKSPYEMRKGNLEWRENNTVTVPIIEVKNQDVSDIMGDMKKGLIQRGNFINDDTNMLINVGQTGIRDTLAHSIYDSKRGENTNGRLSSLYQLESIIKSAICFDTVVSEVGKNKSPNTLFMHKLYAVITYEDNPYLAQLSVEESYSTNRDGSMRGTENRFYNLKDIKIAPIRLNAGFQSHGIPSEDDRAKPYGAIVELTIPQLYSIVKEYDKNFYENEQAPGRAEREAEIQSQNAYEESVKTLEEHNEAVIGSNLTEDITPPAPNAPPTPEKKPNSLNFSFGSRDSSAFIEENGEYRNNFTESGINFGLFGNGITAYDVTREDKETNDYLIVAHISPEGTVKFYVDDIADSDRDLINAEADKQREEFTEYWNNLPIDKRYQEIFYRANMTEFSAMSKDKLPRADFVKKYEKSIIFKSEDFPKVEHLQGTYKIYQLPSGDEYHGIRFESKDFLERNGIQLNHDDYSLIYEGDLSEFNHNNLLEAIYTKFNTEQMPTDFTGHSLSVSDVIVTEIDGEQRAYYCDSIGFTEMPEFFLEKELTKEKLSPTVSDVSVAKETAQETSNKEPEPSKDLSVGDKFLYRDKEYTVTSMSGIYPDDVGISYTDKLSNGAEYEVTENINAFKLVREGQYLGNIYAKEQQSDKSEDIPEKDLQSDNPAPFTITVTTVTVLESEHPQIVENHTYTLAEFDELVDRLNFDWASNRQREIKEYGSIDAAYEFGQYQTVADTDFVINLPNGEKISESLKIGSFYGGLIDYLKDFTKYEELIPEFEKVIDEELTKRNSVIEQLTFDSIPDEQQEIKNEPIIEEAEQLEQDTSQSLDNDITEVKEDSQTDISETSDINATEVINNSGNEVNVSNNSSAEVKEDSQADISETSDTNVTEAENTSSNVEKSQPEEENQTTEQPEDSEPVSNQTPTEEKSDIHKIDYHITDEHIGEGKKSERFKNNIAAIKTLKEIESENRLATPEEQEILAKYVGWGGLSDCFKEKHPSYNKLRHYLTEEEFNAARASTLTAFYTPPVVMQSMYKALGNMGFTNGQILDKTTPRLIQFHTLKNAVKPPFLGGFFISSISAG